MGGRSAGDARNRRPRLLFVLSADFGELFNACYLLHGTRLDARFLLPPRLLRANRAGFGYPASGYASARDLSDAVARERPGLVLLFSGYLFTVNRLLDAAALEALIRAWRTAGIPVATSDPFIGIMAEVDEHTIHPRHPARDVLTRHLREAYATLRTLPHLYLAPMNPTPHPQVSYYNADLARGAGADPDTANPDNATGMPRSWLFVLSPEDYAAQIARRGPEVFLERLAWLLEAAVAGARRPVLVAPQPCLDALRARAGVPPEAAIHAAMGYEAFMRIVREAEYAFYWNAFSASILARLMGHGPFFPFARGHLAQAVPRFAEAAARHFYPGCRIPLLDDAGPPDPQRLRALAARQGPEVFAHACANFARGVPSEEAVARLLATA